jgi:hypothetical protein
MYEKYKRCWSYQSVFALMNIPIGFLFPIGTISSVKKSLIISQIIVLMSPKNPG